ncbi:MAG: hypothetical protein ACJAQW_000001, partial [Paracoccaceae bacterium]
ARKSRRHVLYHRALPRPDQGWIHAVLREKPSQRHLFADRFKPKAGPELGRMGLTFLQSGSRISSYDPP